MRRFILAFAIVLVCTLPNVAIAQNATVQCQTPTAGADCAPKSYVDTAVGAIGGVVNSVGGMSGAISCGSGLSCVGGTISLSSMPPASVRVLLTSPQTYWISTTGNDATGDGSNGNPWKTRQHAYGVIQSKYDAGGQAIFIKSKDVGASNIYQDCFTALGPIVGQSPTQIFFDMQGATIKPELSSGLCGPGSYAFGAAYGASISIENVTLDMCGSSNQDTISIGYFTTVQILDSVTFGCQHNWGFNYITVNGTLYLQNGMNILATSANFTGSWSLGGSTITMTSTAGIYMGDGILLPGADADLRTNVCGLTPTVVTVCYMQPNPYGLYGNAAASFKAAGSGATFSAHSGAQAAIDCAGAGSNVLFATNGVPGLAAGNVSLGNFPFFNTGFFDSLQGCQAIANGLTFSGTAAGLGFYVAGNAVLWTTFVGVPYFPGWYGTYGVNITAGSKVVSTGALTPGPSNGLVPGAYINGYDLAYNCTSTAGSPTVTGCTSASACVAGDRVTGSNTFYNPSNVLSVSGSSITLDTNARSSGSVAAIPCVGKGIETGNYITDYDPVNKTITLARSAKITKTGQVIAVQGTSDLRGFVN